MARVPTVVALVLLLPLAALAAAPSWQEIEARMKEQRYTQALAGTEQRLAEARAQKDGPDVARALVTATQLRLGLQRHEEAVRFLRGQPWPDGLLERTTLRLYLAAALTQYAERYAWEVQRREAVEGSDDVREWTAARIYQEANAQLARAWDDREALGAQRTGALGRYLEPSTYPAGLRDTLRDAVAYLWAGLLADSRGWSPEQSAAVRGLDVGRLLGARGDPRDAGAHPLERLVALLADLEAWHAKAGRREAALEAWLARARLLAQHLDEDVQRSALSEALGRRLEQDRAVAWWAMGQADRAELERARERLTRARDLARAGRDAFPKTLGGERCAALVADLEAPSSSVQVMAVDGPARRSIEVTHKNLPALFARAYALEPEVLVRGRGADLLDAAALERRLAGEKPVASWRVALPATLDLRPHRTFVTPPLRERGVYAVVFSAREDFRADGNPRQVALLQVSPWVLEARLEGPRAQVRVVEGESGRAVKGAEVRLVALDWGRGNREVARATADASGRVTLGDARAQRGGGYLLVAGRGRSAVFMLSGVYLGERGLAQAKPIERALLFTDRSAYRPGQSVRWKVVAFEAREGEVPSRTSPRVALTVVLRDAQGEVVARRTLRTNDFGTGSGEFTVPAGRPLGGWQLSVDGRGGTGFVVEEYKRPTLEVTLPAPGTAPRLGRPATLQGEARYYFGLPVTAGQVRWRVERVPLFWGWGRGVGRIMPPGRRSEVVAAGSTRLDEAGRFSFTFTPQADDALRETGPFVHYVFRAIADVTDEAGETRSGERTFKLGEVALEASIESEARFFRAGATGELEVKRRDLDGNPRAGAGRWRLTRLVPPTQPQLPADLPVEEEEPSRKPVEGEPRVRTEGDGLRPRWSMASGSLAALMHGWRDGAEQGAGTLTHDAEGRARVRLPALKPGAYRLHYETQDPYGSKLEVSRELLVVGEDAPAPLALALQFERARANVGSTVRLLAYSALEGQTLTLELRRPDGKVERREVRAGQPVLIDVPVTRELRGGLTARLSGVRDWQRLEQEQVLEVPYDDRELKLEFSTFRDTLRPGGKETWRLTVRDAKGQPLPARAAEVLAYMYDRSLDLFAEHPAPPWAQLFAQRSRTEPLLMSLGAGPVQFLPGEPEPRREWTPPREDGLRFLEGVAGLGTPRSVFVIEGPMDDRAGGRSMEVSMMARAPGAPRAKSVARQASAAPPPPEGSTPVRTNFAETALWLPHLLTDAKGEVSLEFTVPESVTSWTVWAHALTRELAGGSASRQAQTVKELMVRPYLPRFLREGDAAEVEIAVNNAGAKPLAGAVRIDVVDPRTGQSRLAEFGVREARQPFRVEAGKGTRVRFALQAPARVGEVAFRVEAEAGSLRDGELRPLPILPGRLHLAQSRFVTLKDRDRRTLRFEELASGADPGRVTDQLVVTVDAQLLLSVLAAMPYLVEYPYDCLDVEVDRFATASVLGQLYQRDPALARLAKALSARKTPLERFDQADPNRKVALEETPWLALAQGGKPGEAAVTNVLDPATARATAGAALAKLQAAQLPDGGFPWFRGGPASPFVTVSVLHGLARAAEFGAPVPEELAARAWRYLQGELDRDLLPRLEKEQLGLELLTFLHYVASQPSMARTSASFLTPQARQRILEAGLAKWQTFPPRLKAFLALTLHRAGRAPDARRVFESIMDGARTDEALGTYWLPEERSWLWYNDTVESHATVLAALHELAPDDRRLPGLVQWLLLDKKLNHWKSPRATAEALFALLAHAGGEGLAREERVRVAVGPRVTDFTFSPGRYTGKGNQVVVPGAQVDPRTMSAVEVSKDTPGLAFASATWHFATDALPKEAQGDFLSVTRRYFRRERRGTEAVLTPLEQGTALRPGDELEVQLAVRAKHQAEYVLVRDPRPAGLEPGEVHSGYRFDLGLVRYEEVRDSGTNFFIEQIPAGEYTLRYRLRVATAGTFRAGPATLQPLYAPEFSAYSAGTRLAVEPAKP